MPNAKQELTLSELAQASGGAINNVNGYGLNIDQLRGQASAPQNAFQQVLAKMALHK